MLKNNQNISAKINIPILGNNGSYTDRFNLSNIPNTTSWGGQATIFYNAKFLADLSLTYGFNVFGNNCCCNNKFKNKNYLSANIGGVLSFYKNPHSIEMTDIYATKETSIKMTSNSNNFGKTGVSFHNNPVNIGASISLDYHLVNKNNGKETIVFNLNLNKYFNNHVTIYNTFVGYDAITPYKPFETERIGVITFGAKMPIFKY